MATGRDERERGGSFSFVLEHGMYLLKSYHSSITVHRIHKLRVPHDTLMALDRPSKAVDVQYVQRHWVDSRESLQETMNKMPSTQHNPTGFPGKFHSNRFGDHCQSLIPKMDPR